MYFHLMNLISKLFTPILSFSKIKTRWLGPKICTSSFLCLRFMLLTFARSFSKGMCMKLRPFSYFLKNVDLNQSLPNILNSNIIKPPPSTATSQSEALKEQHRIFHPEIEPNLSSVYLFNSDIETPFSTCQFSR